MGLESDCIEVRIEIEIPEGYYNFLRDFCEAIKLRMRERLKRGIIDDIDASVSSNLSGLGEPIQKLYGLNPKLVRIFKYMHDLTRLCGLKNEEERGNLGAGVLYANTDFGYYCCFSSGS